MDVFRFWHYHFNLLNINHLSNLKVLMIELQPTNALVSLFDTPLLS